MPVKKQFTQTIWVVTREINQYDQDGEYFESAFITKPTPEQLMPVTSANLVYCKWLADTGGGRRDCESEWYHLREIVPGQPFVQS